MNNNNSWIGNGLNNVVESRYSSLICAIKAKTKFDRILHPRCNCQNVSVSLFLFRQTGVQVQVLYIVAILSVDIAHSLTHSLNCILG